MPNTASKQTLDNINKLSAIYDSTIEIVKLPKSATVSEEQFKDISAAMGLFLHAYLRATAILILTHDIKTYMSIAVNLSTEVSAVSIPGHDSDLISELFATLSKKAN